MRYAIERTRADEATRRAANAAQTAQLREQFVAVLGHDLRNPLSSIAMGAGLLLKSGDLTERHLKVIARIASSADRMTRMIRDLLDFTRTRMGGGYELHLIPCSLREVVQQVIEEFEIVHKTRTLIFDADERGWARWDPDRIAQLASNLIGNGIEYSPAHEPVLIALRQTGTTSCSRSPTTGEMIPPAVLPVLFDPFYRVQVKRVGGPRPGPGAGPLHLEADRARPSRTDRRALGRGERHNLQGPASPRRAARGVTRAPPTLRRDRRCRSSSASPRGPCARFRALRRAAPLSHCRRARSR